jgi:hypothetical protein
MANTNKNNIEANKATRGRDSSILPLYQFLVYRNENTKRQKLIVIIITYEIQ